MKALAAWICGLLLSGSSFGCVVTTSDKQPLRVIVPFAVGGPADTGARLILQKYTQVTGIPTVIDNKPGAGGAIGGEIAAKSAPDGCTLLLGSPGPISVAPSLYPNLPYDPVRSFVPIINAIASPFLVVVPQSVKATSIKELVALAGTKRDGLTYGSAGNGSALHLAAELFNMAAGLKMVHVPYKGGGPAMNDLLGGRLDVMFADVALALPHVKDGRIRALAVTGRTRSNLLPQVPALAESGYPDYEFVTWSGFLAPAGTPAGEVGRLREDLAKVLADPNLVSTFASQGTDVVAIGADRFAVQIREEIERYAKVIRAGNIKVD